MKAVELESELHRRLGGAWRVRATRDSGFCGTWEATSGRTRAFVKTAPADASALLRAEHDGLAALRATGTIRVPQVWHAGAGLLVLEWLDFGTPDSGFGARFGRALAALHGGPPPFTPFGWPADNFIGATPQRNRPHADWIAFFREERLRAMAGRLHDPELADAIESVADRLPVAFEDDHEPRPALIHGDLWQGNWGMLTDGTPVVFDPAVSVSDPEMELAMMELFGAPPPGFLAAYSAAGGLDAGYDGRRPLYQLYHVLNHALLFGGSYRGQALALARTLTRAP